jgi:hypothetical protein
VWRVFGCRALLVLVIALALPSPGKACPFCAAVSQTIDEEMQSMDVAVVARLEFAADMEVPGADADVGELPLSRFRVLEVLKGQDWVKVDQEIQATYFGPDEKQNHYLMLAADPPNLMWGNAMMLVPVAEEYVRQITQLPRDPSRLKFFLNYLEHEEELIKRDAYDEFAKAPYQDVIALKDDLDRQQLLDWIRDPDVSIEHRRQNLTMLGVCGQPEDAEVLAELIRSPKQEDRAGLNALIAAYLSLAGAQGLPLINEQLLANDAADYADVHAAIMALRFHGTESEIIPREPLLESMRLILEREDIADLVIPDLARWEDWTVLDRLVELYEKASPKANWVRVPVVNYVRFCPLPEAKTAMERLKQIDPDAVRRASALFPFTAPDQDSGQTTSTNASNEVPPQSVDLLADEPTGPTDDLFDLDSDWLKRSSQGTIPGWLRSVEGWLFLAVGLALLGLVLASLRGTDPTHRRARE